MKLQLDKDYPAGEAAGIDAQTLCVGESVGGRYVTIGLSYARNNNLLQITISKEKAKLIAQSLLILAE